MGLVEQRLEDAVADGEVAAAVLGEQARRPSLELGHLGVGQAVAAFERLGPLERRGGVAQPHALQIGLAERVPGRGPRLAGGGRAGQQARQHRSA